MSNPSKKTTPITINDYVIDASLTETHTFESDVTEFPVEQGSAISDNVRPKPIVVVIDGIVSDTPLGKIADLRGNQGDAGGMNFLPSVDALAALLAIRDARQPVTIATTLQRFENMALVNLEVPRDRQTGASLRFTATFQQITIVTNQRTTVRTTALRTSSPSGQPKKNKGKWATTTGIDGIFVYVFPTSQRAARSVFLGKPIGNDTASQVDYYQVHNDNVPPDGWLDAQNKFHSLTYTSGGAASTAVPASINGHPVSFNPGIRNADGTYTHSGGSWVDDKGGNVVKTVPAGADKWNYVDSPFGPAKL